jgi:hypothetical protein
VAEPVCGVAGWQKEPPNEAEMQAKFLLYEKFLESVEGACVSKRTYQPMRDHAC